MLTIRTLRSLIGSTHIASGARQQTCLNVEQYLIQSPVQRHFSISSANCNTNSEPDFERSLPGPKRFGLEYRYGDPPLYTDHQYQSAIEKDEGVNALAYKEIRFNLIWETNSPLQDDILEKYIRYMMHDGRRYLCYELMHKTFYEVKLTQYKRHLKKKKAAENAEASKKSTTSIDDEEKEVEMNPMALFHRAIENCKPLLITRKVRRGGATYQVPFPLKASESEWMAMRWLNNAIKDRPKPRERHYYEELAQEIIDAAHGRGKVVKRRDDMHKLAQANKAYAHYRWG